MHPMSTVYYFLDTQIQHPVVLGKVICKINDVHARVFLLTPWLKQVDKLIVVWAKCSSTLVP